MCDTQTATVTFVFTDIEGSTRLAQYLGDAVTQRIFADYRRSLSDAVDAAGGHLYQDQGESFLFVFERAPDAIKAAVAAQRVLAAHQWPGGSTLRVRMGLHTGEPIASGNQYVGLDVHRVARICSAGHGGQILLSEQTQRAAAGLPDEISVRDLGSHRLKDLRRPEKLFQVVHPDLPAVFPPLRSLDPRTTNLPIQVSSFVGREQEIARIKEVLDSARLITLTGSGGTGKTRLALQVGAEVVESFKDGVWFVDLASLSSPDTVPQSVASVLRVREQPGLSIVTVIAEHLQTRQMVLIMDNFEHVLEAGTTVSMLLASAQELKVIVTSRERLHLRGEHEFQVPALSLPDLRRLPQGVLLLQYEAVRLFADRAAALSSNFAVTDRNAPAIAEICHRLDGLPLAIELVAPRTKILSVQEISRRLDNRLRFLSGGDQDLPPRQRTLRATIAWSYSLLNQEEQALFRKLSVFAGGCTLEAAEAVCRASDVLELVSMLVDKCMLVAHEAGNGSVRYHLLETLREYARERLLESGEAAEIQRGHRDFFLSLAEEAEPHLTAADQTTWLDDLEREHDNLRTALDGSLESGDTEAALRLAGALWRFWSGRGHLAEGRVCLRRALEQSIETRGIARAKALHAAGNLAWDQGDYKEARVLLSESLEVSRALGDRPGIAAALSNLGNVAKRQGDYAAARALFEESLALSRALGLELGIARALNNLGTVAYELGAYPEARSCYQESLALCRGLGHGVGIAITLNNLADVARREGDHVAARGLFQESLAVARDVGHKPVIAENLRNLGALSEQEGDLALAQSFFEEACHLCRQLGEKTGIARALEGLGGVSAARGDTEHGARLFGAAEAIRERIGAPIDLSNRPDYERRVAKLRDAMSPTMFAAAWRAGGAMTVDQAVEYAMREQSGAGDAPEERPPVP